MGAVWFALTSCKGGKQKEDEEWVDSVLQACDSIPEDTIVYDVQEETLSKAVDENFNDFLYTFINNKRFQADRLALPLKVMGQGETTASSIRNARDFRNLFNMSSVDYFVLLLHDVSELEDDPASQAQRADVHVMDVEGGMMNSFACAREEGMWKMKSVTERSFKDHHGSFLTFYSQFAQDSIFRLAHVAQPLQIAMPDEEGDEMIEGTIDADQFPAFSPELPHGRFMILEYGSAQNANGDEDAMQCVLGTSNDVKRVVMVKCGMSNSMMDVLTFEKEDDEWKLTLLEE